MVFRFSLHAQCRFHDLLGVVVTANPNSPLGYMYPVLSFPALTTSVENWDEKFLRFHYFSLLQDKFQEKNHFELLLYFIGQDCVQKKLTKNPLRIFLLTLFYPPRSSTLFSSCCITCIIVFLPLYASSTRPCPICPPEWFHLPSRLSRVPPIESASFGNHAGW